MGKKIRLIFVIFFTCLFIPIQFNGQTNKQRTDAGKVIEKVVDIGEKGWKLIEGLFPKKHKIPANYIPISPIVLTCLLYTSPSPRD